MKAEKYAALQVLSCCYVEKESATKTKRDYMDVG